MTSKNLIILVLFICGLNCCDNANKVNPQEYVDLVYYKDKNENLTHISTKIIESNDSIGKFIEKHKPRFGYFFSNNIDTDTLKFIYPDSVEIRKIFKQQINNEKFISNFSKLANIKNQNLENFTIDEIMNVASRFFVIVNKNQNGLMLKICGGGNDFEDLNKIKDMTLIESITYEAITSSFDRDRNERPEFLSNARLNFANAIKNPKYLKANDQVELARNEVYENMKTDKDLRDFIQTYLSKNSANLPFTIETGE